MALGLFLGHCEVARSLVPVHVCDIHFSVLNASRYHLPEQIKIKLHYYTDRPEKNGILFLKVG